MTSSIIVTAYSSRHGAGSTHPAGSACPLAGMAYAAPPG